MNGGAESSLFHSVAETDEPVEGYDDLDADRIDVERFTVDAVGRDVDAEVFPVDAKKILIDTDAVEIDADADRVDAEVLAVDGKRFLIDAENVVIDAEIDRVYAENLRVDIEIASMCSSRHSAHAAAGAVCAAWQPSTDSFTTF